MLYPPVLFVNTLSYTVPPTSKKILTLLMLFPSPSTNCPVMLIVSPTYVAFGVATTVRLAVCGITSIMSSSSSVSLFFALLCLYVSSSRKYTSTFTLPVVSTFNGMFVFVPFSSTNGCSLPFITILIVPFVMTLS